MHEALHTLDILNLILDDADLQQADLFHCALACSLWRDVAIPKIWEDIRSTDALFRLLPEEALDPDYDAAEGLSSALDRNDHHHVLPTGWDIFCRRAAFAKRLVLDISVVSSDQQRAFGPVISRMTTFPSLERLVLHGLLQSKQVTTAPCLSLLLLDANNPAREVANLKSIETKQTPVPDIVPLLHLPRARILRSICVTGQIPNPIILSSLFEALSSNIDPITLREVSVTRTLRAPHLYELADSYFLAPAHILPLAAFRRLTRVELLGVAGFFMEDADYARCAEWWPELRVFALEPPVQEGWYPGICTLRAVEAFARGCPDLELLGLPLVSLDVPGDPSPLPLKSSTTPPPDVTIRVVGDCATIVEVAPPVVEVAPPVTDFVPHEQEQTPHPRTRYGKDLASYLLKLFPGLDRVIYVGRTPADAGYNAPVAEGRRSMWEKFDVTLRAMKEEWGVEGVA
ncbi:hypothetical protein BD626DRAFT_633171 [Schizophyllum amplum]|uniref:F-box domain-containing protein n=1 Tax=Schizophyllum amplum TaxID=97359 RepID=A0A550C4D8_9AGAR|nr:hypothetical protein BD626DRAFT_633171 [Auriculariopsis ampla]